MEGKLIRALDFFAKEWDPKGLGFEYLAFLQLRIIMLIKTLAVIRSCTTKRQLTVALKYILLASNRLDVNELEYVNEIYCERIKLVKDYWL